MLPSIMDIIHKLMCCIKTNIGWSVAGTVRGPRDPGCLVTGGVRKAGVLGRFAAGWADLGRGAEGVGAGAEASKAPWLCLRMHAADIT